MEWLNYHHLLYFYTVAREGGLAPAGKVLRLSHPTLSAQVHALEDRLGERLFTRAGRKLALTEMGQLVYRYAEDIFSLGSELLDAVADRATGRPLRFEVGVTDAVPKLIARRLLEPALALGEPLRLVCREGPLDRLLADLATHALDLVLSDAPVPEGSKVKAFDHLLGESGVSFFGTPELAAAHRRGFPRSLQGAPMLLPLEQLTLRRGLDRWFAALGVRPKVVAELEDSALLKELGAGGLGLFPAPTAIEAEVKAQYGVRVLGRTREVRERYHAVTVERRLEHPAAAALIRGARHVLLARGR